MLLADLGNSRYAVKSIRHYETNVFIGKYPKLKNVNKYFGGAIAINTGMNIILPPRHAKTWNKLVITVQGHAFKENERLQIGFNYDL